MLNESRLKITENERKIDEIKNADIIRDEKIKKLDSKCIELELFRTNAEKQKYLFKIDELWDCNEQNQSRIQKNTSAIDSMNRNINQISETEREFDEFKESLKKQKYLFEIDSLFAKNEDVEKNLEITKNEIDELKNGIKSLTETNNVQITKMKKNLLYTKIVCGVAVTGQVVTLVLSILGII